MIGTNRVARICYSIAALIIGGLFFFDIIGVFGLSLAIVGLIVFVVCSLVVFRLAPAEGAPQ